MISFVLCLNESKFKEIKQPLASLLSYSLLSEIMNTVYEIHIFELRNEEINVKIILAVINATYAVAKRKPEKIG